MKEQHTNRLIHARSPYLLQHSHNPVDWFEWSQEALDKAKKEDKLILVSIGYSACHWCHVMERESFENDEIAELMNTTFVCIKVDREERPDIDQVYMEAVQALGVNGGWPLNVFLTPDQRPFFGGTYFSPQAWTHIINNVMSAYRERREIVESTAATVTDHIASTGIQPNETKAADLIKTLEEGYARLESRFDTKYGGFGQAPKFIMPSIWQFLLRYHAALNSNPSVAYTSLTLDKMLQGGIYDHVGGGFARYSVDAEWFAPHFEKMLYDNAQLLSLFSEAYTVTVKPSYKKVVYDTVAWLEREMLHPAGGFYSALDADSEGEEGKYYAWTYDEFKKVLGTDAHLMAEFFSVHPAGNWEDEKNILTRRIPIANFADQHKLDDDQLEEIIVKTKKRLLRARAKRIRPGCDDKILLGWNALTISGLTDCYRVFGERDFLELALKCANFLEKNLIQGDILLRSWRETRSTTQGFLDDYAFYIKACVDLYQVTFDEKWIERAAALARYVIKDFYDEEDGLFYFTSVSSNSLIVRKKEIFDNVIPSSNAMMARNLLILGTMMDEPEWSGIAEQMVEKVSGYFKSDLQYLSEWAIAALEIQQGFDEVTITGNQVDTYRSQLQRHFIPFSLTMGKTKANTIIPQLAEKEIFDNRTAIYLCRKKTCQLPVFETATVMAMLKGTK